MAWFREFGWARVQIMSPPRGRLGWLLRARPNRSGEVWSVRIPDVETPISITRYVRRDRASVERP
eukprot:6222655-Alexandrium_andersonii.AAC.1